MPMFQVSKKVWILLRMKTNLKNVTVLQLLKPQEIGDSD